MLENRINLLNILITIFFNSFYFYDFELAYYNARGLK